MILSSAVVCLSGGNPNADKSVKYSSAIKTGLLPAAHDIVLAAASSAVINPKAAAAANPPLYAAKAGLSMSAVAWSKGIAS